MTRTGNGGGRGVMWYTILYLSMSGNVVLDDGTCETPVMARVLSKKKRTKQRWGVEGCAGHLRDSMQVIFNMCGTLNNFK